MSTQTPETVVVEPTQSKDFTPNFGNGRYSKAANEFWKDLQRLFKISPQAAERITQHWMRNYGDAMKNADIVAKVTGKPSDKGELTLKDTSKTKIVATYPISLARLCTYLDESLKFGILPNKCQYVLIEQLDNYVRENEQAVKSAK